MPKKIVIVGGGFAGVAAALRLSRKKLPDTKIVLISDRPHFEYHGALYRLVTGGSPMEICIPLRDIFLHNSVEVVEDSVVNFDYANKTINGASGARYQFTDAILALGAETNYFNIPGLAEYSFGMKSITDALRLKRHITETLRTCGTAPKDEQTCAAHFVVVGGGPTGIELSGDLITYTRNLAKEYGLDPHLIAVDLIEGSPRILPTLPETFTKHIEHHLRGLGVNIFTNRNLEREEVEGVYLKDMQLKTKTVIWTAGVRAHHLYTDWHFPIDQRGRVRVNAQFQVEGMEHVYVGGDAAVAEYWGMAQTAHLHGTHIAEVIAAKILGNTIPLFEPKLPVYAIPSGPAWAGVLWGNFKFYGRIGWGLRRAADLVVFSWLLPPKKALAVFRNGQSICDECRICK